MKFSRSLVGWAVLAALSSASQSAQASGLQLIEQNGGGTGNAFAGQAAAAENASTVFFNPAGMTYLPGRHLSGALHGIRPTIKFSDDGGSRSPAGIPAPLGGGNGGDAGGWNWIPNFDLTWQLTPRLWAGVGVTAPFGLKTHYDAQFIGRFQSRQADISTLDVNPSIAYRINDVVSLGAGVSYQRAKVDIERSFFAGVELPQAVKLDDGAWGWNVGAMFNLGSATRVGLTYRSEMQYDFSGTVAVAGVGSAAAAARATLPATASMGLSHQLNDRWQLLGDVTWTQWSRLQDVDVILTSAGLGAIPAGAVVDTLDLRFRNTYRIGVGLNYRWSGDLTLRFGVAYDRSPVPDSLHRLPILPDNDRTWMAVGAKFQLSKAGALDVGYAHLFVDNPAVLRNRGVGVLGAQGILSGSFRESAHVVSVQYSHSF